VSSTGRLPDYDSTRKGQQGAEGETLVKRDWEEVARWGRLLGKVRVDDEEVEGRQQGACKKPVLMGLRQFIKMQIKYC